MAAQEEESPKLEGSSSTGVGNFGKLSSRKQQKQKKVPQRGLGVAQLEKIRIEEQRKKEQADMAATSALSPPRSVSQAAVSSVDHPPQNDVPEIGVRHPTTVLMPRAGLKLWNSSDISTEIDNPNSNTQIGLRSSWRTAGDSDAMFPIPAPLPRIHNYLNHSSLLNLPSATLSSSSSSSMMNFRMEPPSNQTYHSNFIPIPSPSDIDKMVGMKRPCPFQTDKSLPPPLRSNIENSIHKLNELSRGSESKYSIELGNSSFREVVSCSTRNPEANSLKSSKRSPVFGEVLTLATPSTWKSPKFIEPPASLCFKNYNFPDSVSLPYQTYLEEPNFQLGTNWADRHQPYYTFFPPTKAKESQSNPGLKIGDGESEEYIDLNLKL